MEAGSNKKSLIGLFIFIAIIITVLIVAILLPGKSLSFKAVGDKSIAVLKVEGVISSGGGSIFSSGNYNHEWTLEQIANLKEDSLNAGLILFVNSPGGGVYESDELYKRLLDYREKTKRPVYACMGNIAASGGYYISQAAQKIFASPNTTTGSIGVIMTLADTSELEKKIGIKTTYITSGPNKAMGHPLTEQQRNILQGIVDETYNSFISIVEKGRKMDRQELLPLADGRIYTGNQALKLKLVDELGGLNTAIAAMKKDFNIEAYSIKTLENKKSFFEALFSSYSSIIPINNEFESTKRYVESMHNGTPMYIYKAN